jgi:hypothetical protein
MTWNQVSGFLLAAFAIGMLFWFDTRQPAVTPDNDRKQGATSPIPRSPVASTDG